MSQTHFSNASTGSKPSDPYKEKALETDLSLEKKVEDLLSFIKEQKFGMMTTRQADSGHLFSRAMAIAGEDDGLDLLFHTNTESGKTDDLQSDNHTNISFINSSGEWASISGTCTILTDRESVKAHYSSSLKAWLGDLKDGKHDGGPNDPRIGVIKVRMVAATYALKKKGGVARGMSEVAKGMVTGETAAPNKLREITTEEVETYRQSKKLIN